MYRVYPTIHGCAHPIFYQTAVSPRLQGRDQNHQWFGQLPPKLQASENRWGGAHWVVKIAQIKPNFAVTRLRMPRRPPVTSVVVTHLPPPRANHPPAIYWPIVDRLPLFFLDLTSHPPRMPDIRRRGP